jgi:hypothetical protein
MREVLLQRVKWPTSYTRKMIPKSIPYNMFREVEKGFKTGLATLLPNRLVDLYNELFENSY